MLAPIDAHGGATSDESASAESDYALSRLKALLLSDERQDLALIERRISLLETFNTDLDERKRKVSEVLAPALHETAEAHPETMAHALGPAINEGIRDQMANSRDEMVAALHPLAGRLVAAAVADMFNRLAEQVNERLDKLFSWRGLLLNMKARLTGQSVATLVLNDLRKSELKRVYLFELRSHDIKFYWPNSDALPPPTQEVVDEIGNAVQVLSHVGDSSEMLPLRAMTLGDREITLQNSATHVVAIETVGKLTESRKTLLAEAGLSLLEYAGSNPAGSDASLQAAAMRSFARRVEALQHAPRGKRRFNPAYAIAGTIILALVGWLGWNIAQQRQIDKRIAAIETSLAQTFADGRGMFDVEPVAGGDRIAVRGVAFSGADSNELQARLQSIAAPSQLDFELALWDVDADRRRQSDLAADLAAARQQLAATGEALADLRQSNRKAPQPPALVRLDRWIASNVIFFAQGAEFREAERAGAKLDNLAVLLTETPGTRIGLTGHTDSTGSRETNLRIAQARIEAIISALEERGIERSRIIPLGVATAEQILSIASGPDSPNRRVEFSRMFAEE